MKYIRGFLMAWGNFSSIPCPYHKWHSESRKAMLCTLPLVGIMLAVIVILAWWILNMIGSPAILTGAILTVLYFLANGFIHLDGFMDCSDAILSRRPEPEERQRILKASDVGAFAVISVILMFMIFTVSMMVLAYEFNLQRAVVLLAVMIVSRGIGADYVLRKPPMTTSQYVDLDGESTTLLTSDEKKRMNAIEHWTLNLIVAFSIVAIYYIFYENGESLTASAYYLAVICVVLLAAMTAGRYGMKQLGGMNGDIAGYMIVISETAGVLTTALLAHCFGI